MLLPLFQYLDQQKRGYLTVDGISQTLHVVYPEPHKFGELHMIYLELQENVDQIDASKFVELMKTAKVSNEGLGRLKVFEIIGGNSTVRQMVDSFYDMAVKDEVLLQVFSRLDSIEQMKNVMWKQY
jgi:hypothetical protein